MPHDGQPIPSPLLPDLTGLTAAAVPAAEALLDTARARLGPRLAPAGKIDAAALEREQTAAHALAWLATYAEALRQMQAWAERLDAVGALGETEALILQIGFGEYLWQIYGGLPMSQGEMARPQDIGLDQPDCAVLMVPAVQRLTQAGNSAAARARLATLMRAEGGRATVGAAGLDDELEMIRDQFRRFALAEVAPHAHGWHLDDALIPLDLIGKLADMGVFGLTIPEEFGGLGLSKESMVVVSEELSRGWIGVGSLATRSEIAAELILGGGTDAQKARWLPGIASGEILPTA